MLKVVVVLLVVACLVTGCQFNSGEVKVIPKGGSSSADGSVRVTPAAASSKPEPRSQPASSTPTTIVISQPAAQPAAAATPDPAAAAAAASAAQAAALAAIERLRAAELAAVLAGDVARQRSLWTRDALVLPPDGEPRGLAGSSALIAAGCDRLGDAAPLEYALEFRDLEIDGDLAHEWATYTARHLEAGTGELVEATGLLLRVLRRDDGEWRVARSMWTVDAPGAPALTQQEPEPATTPAGADAPSSRPAR